MEGQLVSVGVNECAVKHARQRDETDQSKLVSGELQGRLSAMHGCVVAPNHSYTLDQSISISTLLNRPLAGRKMSRSPRRPKRGPSSRSRSWARREAKVKADGVVSSFVYIHTFAARIHPRHRSHARISREYRILRDTASLRADQDRQDRLVQTSSYRLALSTGFSFLHIQPICPELKPLESVCSLL
jgi:hypothetical protein